VIEDEKQESTSTGGRRLWEESREDPTQEIKEGEDTMNELPVEKLEVIEELNNGRGYKFDMFRIYQDPESKRLFWVQDSGCSCPTPFEGVRSTADMDGEITSHNFSAFERALDSFWDDLSQKMQIETMVKKILNENTPQ
jgi:hypothetical protein